MTIAVDMGRKATKTNKQTFSFGSESVNDHFQRLAKIYTPEKCIELSRKSDLKFMVSE